MMKSPNGQSAIPQRPVITILPGAGSAGISWRQVAVELDARVLPIPDLSSVSEMADSIDGQLSDVTEPLVLVGASLGAMVAIELTYRRPVAGLVLMAAGFGVRVGPRLIQRLESADADTTRQIAVAGLGVVTVDAVAARFEDIEARGLPVLARHLKVLGEYAARPPSSLTPTVVLHGTLDRSVPAEAHHELAAQCQGVLRTLDGIGHSAYLEAPQEVVRWTRFVADGVAAQSSERASRDA